jgi:predicted DCC family thiol-disulfide oxidoreductase YuxK
MSGMTVAVYDGYCVICNTTRRIVTALDWFKRVEFVDLHDRTTIEARFPQLDHTAAMGAIHVYDARGREYIGFEATRRMLRDLPVGLPLWALLHMPVIGNWLGPRLYRIIATNRYTINRLLGVHLDQIEREEQDCADGVCKLPQMTGSKTDQSVR